MSGFYGSSLIAPMGFEIDLRYPNKKVMDENANSDGVMVGRYVLVDYYQKDPSQTDNKLTIYQYNYQKDTSTRSYDSTLWVKIYDSADSADGVNGAYKYVMVADLNGADVGIKLVAPGTYDSGTDTIVDFTVSDDSSIRYLHLPRPWDIQIIDEDFDYGASGFEKEKFMDEPAKFVTVSLEAQDTNEDKINDIKVLKFSFPGIGYAISQVHNEVYGKDRKWADGEPPIEDGKPNYDTDPCLVQEIKKAVHNSNQSLENTNDFLTNSSNDFNKLLDEFYGAKIDTNGDTVPDTRPWADNNIPTKDGANDYEANCVLSETRKALDTMEKTQDKVLDAIYGNNRDWDKGNVPTTDGNPLKTDGSNLDTSDACILLDVKQAIIRSDNAMNDTLDKFYGESSRSWIDETKYPTTTDSSGNIVIDYTQDECYVSNILEATENANKALVQTNANIIDTNDLLDKFYGKVQDTTTGDRTWENNYPIDGDGVPNYNIDPCVVSKTEKMLDAFYGLDDDGDGVRPWENGIPVDGSGKVNYSSECILSKNKLAVDEVNGLLNKSYGKDRKWSDPAHYPSIGTDTEGNPIYNYDEDSCLISNVLKATELANEATAETKDATDAVLDDFYGKDRKWIKESAYPDVDADGVPDYDTDSCIVSKVEKLLDNFYGLKVDTDGDGIVDTRPWSNGLDNPPLKNGSIDYSKQCILSETKKAIENSNKIENTLDKLYGQDTDGDGKRPWEDEINPPTDSSGNIDYASSPCVISKVEKILNNIYGIMQDSSGNRTWEDGNTPTDSVTGKIDYSTDTCLISQVKEATEKANEAADVLNTFTNTFNELTDGVIPYVKVIDGKKEFYGMTLVAGDDVFLEEIPDTSGTGVRTIKISIAVSAAEILPFEATPSVS